MKMTKTMQNRSNASQLIRRTLLAMALLSVSAGAFANLNANPCANGKEGIGYDYCMATIGGASGGHGTSGAGGVGVGGLGGSTVPAKDPIVKVWPTEPVDPKYPNGEQRPFPTPSSSGTRAEDFQGVFGSTANWKTPAKPKPISAAFCTVNPKTNKRVCSAPF